MLYAVAATSEKYAFFFDSHALQEVASMMTSPSMCSSITLDTAHILQPFVARKYVYQLTSTYCMACSAYFSFL